MKRPATATFAAACALLAVAWWPAIALAQAAFGAFGGGGNGSPQFESVAQNMLNVMTGPVMKYGAIVLGGIGIAIGILGRNGPAGAKIVFGAALVYTAPMMLGMVIDGTGGTLHTNSDSDGSWGIAIALIIVAGGMMFIFADGAYGPTTGSYADPNRRVPPPEIPPLESDGPQTAPRAEESTPGEHTQTSPAAQSATPDGAPATEEPDAVRNKRKVAL